jgi:hypothetical protein
VLVLRDGARHKVRAGSLAHPAAAVVELCPDVWEPVHIDYPAEGGHAWAPLSAGASAVRAAELGGVDGDGAPAPSAPPTAGVTTTALATGGQQAGGGIAPTPPPAKPTGKAVRAWARERGMSVPARGPLPDDVVAAYQADQVGRPDGG